MDQRVVRRQWVGVLLGVLTCTTVAQGQTVYTQGANLYVGGSANVTSNATISGHASVTSYLDVDGYLDVQGYLEAHDDLDVDGYGVFYDDVLCMGDVGAFYTMGCNGDAIVGGKLELGGSVDPPYVLYDQQSREEIVDRMKKETAPDKQDGAAMFLNRETKRLEIYVASEAKFYDLQGNVIYQLPQAVAPVTQYATTYYLDPSTGDVKSRQKAIKNKFRVREGCALDDRTGKFVNQVTGQEVSREDALEWCGDDEAVYRDIGGKVLRADPRKQQVQYVAQYQFDPDTGGVRVRRRAVHDRYAIKAGYEFDPSTGQFLDKNTSQTVAREQAVELVKAADVVDQMRNKTSR